MLFLLNMGEVKNICMDIKKFVNSREYEMIGSIIMSENKIIKNSQLNKTIEDGMEGLFKLSSLDYFNLDMSNNMLCGYEKFIKNNSLDVKTLCLSGPLVKCIFDKNIKNVKPLFIVDLIGGHDIIGQTHTFDMIEFKINKKQYKYFNYIILNREPIDRVGWIDGEIWVGGGFINELFKRLSYYDPNLFDPIFNITHDYLNISRGVSINYTIKEMIEKVDIKSLHSLDRSVLQNTIINVNGNNYQSIEYVMYCMTVETNKLLLYKYREIILFLSDLQYFRHPIYVAKMLKIDTTYPIIYNIVSEMGHKYAGYIANLNDVNSLNICSTNQIDLLLLTEMIKHDDINFFIFCESINIIDRFKYKSKISQKFVDLIIEHKAYTIMSKLIEIEILDFYKYKMIFLTEHLDMLDKQYVDYIKQDNKNDITISREKKELLFELLEQTIQMGLASSFYAFYKLFPSIIDSDQEDVLIDRIKDDSSSKILEIILKINPTMINHIDSNGKTALIRCAELGMGRCVNILLNCGADYEIVDGCGDTYIHKLAEKYHIILQQVIRKSLKCIDMKNNLGKTPAIVAAENSNEEGFYILKGLIANLIMSDNWGNTAYHYICHKKICLGMIIINYKNKFNLTPEDYCTIDRSFYHFQEPVY